MFLLKKIAAPFLIPVSVVLILALGGLFCLWFTRRQKTGKALVTVAIGLLGLLSYDQVSNLLAGPLEKKYPPITNMASVQGGRGQGTGGWDQESGVGSRESGGWGQRTNERG